MSRSAALALLSAACGPSYGRPPAERPFSSDAPPAEPVVHDVCEAVPTPPALAPDGPKILVRTSQFLTVFYGDGEVWRQDFPAEPWERGRLAPEQLVPLRDAIDQRCFQPGRPHILLGHDDASFARVIFERSPGDWRVLPEAITGASLVDRAHPGFGAELAPAEPIPTLVVAPAPEGAIPPRVAPWPRWLPALAPGAHPIDGLGLDRLPDDGAYERDGALFVVVVADYVPHGDAVVRLVLDEAAW